MQKNINLKQICNFVIHATCFKFQMSMQLEPNISLHHYTSEAIHFVAISVNGSFEGSRIKRKYLLSKTLSSSYWKKMLCIHETYLYVHMYMGKM